MNILTYFIYALTMVSSVAAGTYLAATNHYGYAWIPFLLAFSMQVKSVKPYE